MGAAGSVQASAEAGVVVNEKDGVVVSQAAFPEKLTEEQCKQLLVSDWSADHTARFNEIAADGTITKEQFIEEIKKNA